MKDYSSLFHSQQKLYARGLIDQKATSEQIAKIKQQAYNMEDILTVLTHHDAITGTSFQYVAQDYALRLSAAFEESKATYKKDIYDLVKS